MGKPLRALLLAAGLGTRLRPLTHTTPKCLVEVAGEPLLGRWLTQLERAGCEAVLINTHHLADQVAAYVNNRESGGMVVTLAHEPELLGTAGTLLAHQSFFAGSTGLLIHADNVMAEDLRAVLSAHQRRAAHCLLTMLTFTTENPSACGIVQLDDRGVVTGFQEKQADATGNRANGALYVFEANFLDAVKRLGPNTSDFSTQVIPAFLGRIQTSHTTDVYLDIGTPAALQQANRLLTISE